MKCKICDACGIIVKGKYGSLKLERWEDIDDNSAKGKSLIKYEHLCKKCTKIFELRITGY